MGTEGFDIQGLIGSAQGLISTWGLKVVGGFAVLIIGMIVAKTVRASVRKALLRSKLDDTLMPFLSGIVYYLLLAFVFVAVLSLFGVETTSFIAVLGAAGFAVGMALQGTLSNFASGVMLLFFRPFSVGDYIDAGGTSGTVVEIGIFATTLKSPDNVKIITSNSAVYGATIKNFSAFDTRRVDMVVGVSYDDDLGKAMETINRVVAGDSRVLKDPEPVVAVSELADSSVNLICRPWTTPDDYWGVYFDTMEKGKAELEKAGISIPFPQRDVHLIKEAGAA